MKATGNPKILPQYDVVVIGGGIVGLATAGELLERRPGLRLIVVEKENRLGAHQSGRNSGVIHSGVYYRPGSLKAINCRRGRALLLELCEREGIRYDLCGKVIVASTERECAMLQRLAEFGTGNGVAQAIIDRSRLRELEPHADGLRALHVRDAGIVNFGDVCQRLAERVGSCDHATIGLSAEVCGFYERRGELVIETTLGPLFTHSFVNAAGLHCDRVARLAGAHPPVSIIPFRGQYFTLRQSAESLVRALVYPVPNPEFPFLGVHLTKHLDGSVSCGPSATLALAREAYGRFDWDGEHLRELLENPGFWRMLGRYRNLGMNEYLLASSRARFADLARRLVPELTAKDLQARHCGIRAQAVAPDGRLVDDFAFGESVRGVHVYNAPSPAATASLNIAKHVADRLEAHLPSASRSRAAVARHAGAWH